MQAQLLAGGTGWEALDSKQQAGNTKFQRTIGFTLIEPIPKPSEVTEKEEGLSFRTPGPRSATDHLSHLESSGYPENRLWMENCEQMVQRGLFLGTSPEWREGKD